jgi:hypothetical protein
LAEDVASEAFLIALDRRHGHDGARGDVRSWLYGIASNLVARYARAETRRYKAVGPQEAGDHADAVAGRLDAVAVRGRLGGALRLLPEPRPSGCCCSWVGGAQPAGGRGRRWTFPPVRPGPGCTVTSILPFARPASAADGVDEWDVPGTVSACVNPGIADADTARNEVLMSMEGVCF